MNVYFDNAASTRVRDESIEVMSRVMREDFGNPSSMHALGRRAKNELEGARKSIASALGAKSENIYFTSGGTEANNWAILGVVDGLARKGRHIITSVTEHSAVMAPMKKLESMGWDVTYLMPDSSGHIPVQDFSAALRDDTVFTSILLVHNETGVVNPIGEYAGEIKRRGLSTVMHTDAIQAFCKIPPPRMCCRLPSFAQSSLRTKHPSPSLKYVPRKLSGGLRLAVRSRQPFAKTPPPFCRFYIIRRDAQSPRAFCYLARSSF